MKKITSILLGVFIVLGVYAINSNFVLAQGKVVNGSEGVGVNLSGDCLRGMGQNCFQYETMMGIDDVQPGSGYTATSIAQDVVFSATYMVGTVLTIVIIVCGLGYIFSSASGKDNTSSYKKGLIYAAIGAVLVRGAYAIVRLIQYIAKG